MTLQTKQKKPSMVQSNYANKSVEKQGEILHDAALNGTLKDFTDADWDVFMGSGALGWKDGFQRLFLHLAAIYGHLNQIPHPVWQALIAQGLLKQKDSNQMLFLHWAAYKGYLDQIPHYVFAHMTSKRGYGEDFWLSKDSLNRNILDNAAGWDDGERFPKAMILPLWRGRQAVLTTLWAEMRDDLKGKDGVREAYERFLNNKIIWTPPKKRLVPK